MRSTSNRVYPNGTSSPSSRVALGGWSTFRLCVLDALFVALVIILVFLVLREACKLVVVVVVVVTVDLDFANEEDDEEANIVIREDADGRPAEEEEEEAEEARINLDDGAQSMILFLFFRVCACA